ncbi:hypothetical protein ACVW0P_003875 [Mucilaginibacter sp. UYNi724]
MENFQKLKELILSAESDATAFFEKSNKAAGTRLRNALQQTKALAQELRNEVTDVKNKAK